MRFCACLREGPVQESGRRSASSMRGSPVTSDARSRGMWPVA
jgi:hypothetical protein